MRVGTPSFCICRIILVCRSKEMSSLKIRDVVDSTGEFKTEVLLKRNMTKNSKQRRFYLTNEKLIKVLADYLKQRKTENTYGLDSALILSQKNGHFNPNTMQQLFARMYGAVGLDGASSHSGRRTFATRCLENGVGIKNLQTLLGHSSINTTATYAEENPVLLGKISANLSI